MKLLSLNENKKHSLFRFGPCRSTGNSASDSHFSFSSEVSWAPAVVNAEPVQMGIDVEVQPGAVNSGDDVGVQDALVGDAPVGGVVRGGAEVAGDERSNTSAWPWPLPVFLGANKEFNQPFVCMLKNWLNSNLQPSVNKDNALKTMC
jgi:hypothetical protein